VQLWQRSGRSANVGERSPASFVFFVTDTAVGRNRFSFATVCWVFPTDPALGLKMICSFVLSNRLSMFECVAQHSAFRLVNFGQVTASRSDITIPLPFGT
jgi:hypothetical protein